MSDSRKSSPWVWISLGLIIGLFVAFIIFLDQKIVKNARQQQQELKQQNDVSKPKFDFYTVLPERKVDIPDKPKLEQDVPNKKSGQKSSSQFMLQAGSFHKMQDADRQKAELALLGLEASIKSAKVNGVTYHRVELGPFEDGGFFSQVERRLIQNDIPFIKKSIK